MCVSPAIEWLLNDTCQVPCPWKWNIASPKWILGRGTFSSSATQGIPHTMLSNVCSRPPPSLSPGTLQQMVWTSKNLRIWAQLFAKTWRRVLFNSAVNGLEGFFLHTWLNLTHCSPSPLPLSSYLLCMKRTPSPLQNYDLSCSQFMFLQLTPVTFFPCNCEIVILILRLIS